MRMSNTFAVETYSGGSLRIASILTRPSLRSFLSCARLTRMSFARLSASILWSRERAGACPWVFVEDTTERASLTQWHAGSIRDAHEFSAQRAESSDVCDSARVVDVSEPERAGFGVELGTDSRRRVGVAEEDRAERDVVRAGRDELERVAPGHHATHR